MSNDHEMHDDLHERLSRVEVQIGAIYQDMIEVKDSLKEIASSLKTLAVLEEKHANTAESLKRAFTEIGKLQSRCGDIEKKLPTAASLAHMIPILFK